MTPITTPAVPALTYDQPRLLRISIEIEPVGGKFIMSADTGLLCTANGKIHPQSVVTTSADELEVAALATENAAVLAVLQNLPAAVFAIQNSQAS